MKLTMNMNDQVKVKLTKAGLDELRKQHEHYCPKSIPFNAPKVDENGYSQFQLHALMSQLGGLCTIGNSDLPFETDILIESK